MKHEEAVFKMYKTNIYNDTIQYKHKFQLIHGTEYMTCKDWWGWLSEVLLEIEWCSS